MLQSNPTCFIGLPRHVRRTMILNGIAAAEGCGFQTRSTYAAFISLQCHASPDFHLHPDIQAIFQLELPEQQCMDAILEDVSEQTWTDIQADANPCAWFEPRRPEQLAIRTAARVCANFPEIVDANQEAEIVTFFRAAVFRAAQHGINWDEGIAAFAAALYLYGPQLDQADGPRWAGAVFLSSKFSSAKIANLLRTRIALDTIARCPNEAKTIPCFKLGKKRKFKKLTPDGKKAYVKELAKRLRGQEEAISSMTADEFKMARDKFVANGRHSGAKDEQEIFRKRLTQEIDAGIYNSMEAKLGPRKAKEYAKIRSKEVMSTIAALHEPDMVAGSWHNIDQEIKRAGRSDINSSIGASWNQGGRLTALDKAAEDARLAGKESKKMNILLAPCTQL